MSDFHRADLKGTELKNRRNKQVKIYFEKRHFYPTENLYDDEECFCYPAEKLLNLKNFGFQSNLFLTIYYQVC
jgi:hypothetical protein